MASRSGCKPSSPRSLPRRCNVSLLQNYVIVKVMLKAIWGQTEGLMLLSWSVLFLGGRVVRQGRWEGSEVARWERWEGNEVARWENDGAERWEVPGFIEGWGIQNESKIFSFCF